MSNIELSEFTQNNLLAHQPPHVKNLLYVFREKQRSCALDGSETGTGKTYTTCAIAREMGLKLLVICPKPAIPNWYRIAQTFGLDVLGVINYETAQNGKYYETLTHFYDEVRYMCPYLTVNKQQATDSFGNLVWTEANRPKMKVISIDWELPRDVLLVWDESHKGKSGFYAGQTVNNKLMVSVKSHLSAPNRKFCIMLSATITDKLENFDMAGYLLGLYQPHMKRVFDRFIQKVERKFNGNPLSGINKLVYPHFGSRMTIADIEDKFEDFQRSIIKAKAYKIDAETAAKIEFIHQQIQSYLAALRAKGMPERGWGYVIRCWQKIELLKVPLGIRRIKKNYHAGRSVAVFISYTQTKRSLLEGITTGPLAIPIGEIEFIDGQQKADERDFVVNSFQSDHLRVLICQIKAGGTALSLHDVCGRPRTSVIFPTWSAIDFKQALGRVDRASSQSQAIQELLYVRPSNPLDPEDAEKLRTMIQNDIPLSSVSEDIQAVSRSEEQHTTIEEQICQIVRTKLDNIDLINNGILTGENIFDIVS